MGLKIIDEALNGLKLIEPKIFQDRRGFFMESYNANDFEQLGLPTNFVQDNHSCSAKGVIRGMHFQWDKPQGKLIRVTSGSAFVVEIDLRKKSPSFGKWKSFELSAKNKHILWVPPGFANGFLALEDNTEMMYKCTAIWNPIGENNILWNDPDIKIDWNCDSPNVSERDKEALTFSQWCTMPESDAFSY
jgi:dTDP-4-dehydrorhamnose 3,5-epimerase